jgi:transposase-like protein
MSPPIPRVARVPLTVKQPEACPHCGGRNLTRRGTRRKKLEIVQLWRCSACKRTFTPGPAALHNKTYPLRVILSAVTDYDLGYSLKQTAARLSKKTGQHVSTSTIAAWLEQYKNHCSYRRLRSRGLRHFPPQQTIRSIKLYHRQIYGYAFHRPKLEFLRAGSLDEKRAGDRHLAAVADFFGEHSLHLSARSILQRRSSQDTRIAGHASLGGRLSYHREPEAERSDAGSCTHRSCRRQQQAPTRESSTSLS